MDAEWSANICDSFEYNLMRPSHKVWAGEIHCRFASTGLIMASELTKQLAIVNTIAYIKLHDPILVHLDTMTQHKD